MYEITVLERGIQIGTYLVEGSNALNAINKVESRHYKNKPALEFVARKVG